MSTKFCDLNKKDANGCTALHFAALLGNSNLVSCLLESGANANSADAEGATPIHYAVQANSLDTVEALMRHPEVIYNVI